MKGKTVFTLLAAALLAIWIDAAQARRRAETTLASLATKREALTKEIDDRARRLEAEAARAIAPPPRNEKNVAPAASPVVKKAAPAPAAATPDVLANDPKLQVLELQRVRAGVALDYGEFFRTRGLSPAQVERFFENKTRQAELDLDLDFATTGQDAAGRRAARTLRQQNEADYGAAQLAALGPENYRALLDYDGTLLVRNGIVNALAGSVALAGRPLTAEQGDRLFQAALAAAGDDPGANGFELARRIDWARLDGQARQILTPEQFALFQSAAPQNEGVSRWQLQIEAIHPRRRPAAADGK